MKHLVAILVCLSSVALLFSAAHAKSRIYVEEVTYQAGELDSEFSSRAIAREQVKQRIFDHLADASESMSRKFKFPFDRNLATTLFSCLVRVVAAREKWKDRSFYYRGRTRANLGKVWQEIGNISERPGIAAAIRHNRIVAEDALEEIERIRGGMASPNGKNGQQDTYDSAVSRLHAADCYEAGRFSEFSGKYDEAMEAYSEAIQYDPSLPTAYHNRGQIYLTHRRDREKGLSDIDTAVRLYHEYAVGQRHLEAYRSCVDALSIITAITTKKPEVYFERAFCNVGLNQQTEAREDFRKAAKLGHKEAQELLISRGIKWDQQEEQPVVSGESVSRDETIAVICRGRIVLCYRKAAKLCSRNGYEVVKRDKDRQTRTKILTVRCRE